MSEARTRIMSFKVKRSCYETFKAWADKYEMSYSTVLETLVENASEELETHPEKDLPDS